MVRCSTYFNNDFKIIDYFQINHTLQGPMPCLYVVNDQSTISRKITWHMYLYELPLHLIKIFYLDPQTVTKQHVDLLLCCTLYVVKVQDWSTSYPLSCVIVATTFLDPITKLLSEQPRMQKKIWNI